MARSVVYEDESNAGTRLSLEPMEDRLLVSINHGDAVFQVSLMRSDVERLRDDLNELLRKDIPAPSNG